MKEILVGSTRIKLVKGDITEIEVDAIVNAANSHLQLGGGVAGAIRERGGLSIQEECDEIGECAVGAAVSTIAGDLPAKRVIHAVGPRMGDGLEGAKMRSATLSALHLAEREDLQSIAFPAISSGIFGVPVKDAAEAMLSMTVEHLRKGSPLGLVVFCLFEDETFDVFKGVLKGILEKQENG